MPDPTTPKYIDGDKVTQAGIAWEERQQDGDYMYALTHHSEPPDPADYDDFDDRDYDPPDMTFECRTCGKRWTDDDEDQPCPYCDSMDYRIVEGRT